MQTTLQRFPIDKIKPDPIILIIGPRAVGKTSLSIELVKKMGIEPEHTVILTDEGASGDELWVESGFTPFHNTECLDVMREQRQDGATEHKIIVDSTHVEYQWTPDATYPRALFMNGRQLKTGLIMEMDYPQKLVPWARANIEYVFILGNAQSDSHKRNWELYAGRNIPSYEAYKEIFSASQVCRDYTALVIDCAGGEGAVWFHEVEKSQ
jgi:hypothetical protein